MLKQYAIKQHCFLLPLIIHYISMIQHYTLGSKVLVPHNVQCYVTVEDSGKVLTMDTIMIGVVHWLKLNNSAEVHLGGGAVYECFCLCVLLWFATSCFNSHWQHVMSDVC